MQNSSTIILIQSKVKVILPAQIFSKNWAIEVIPVKATFFNEPLPQQTLPHLSANSNFCHLL
jgi:hypothetical protein